LHEFAEDRAPVVGSAQDLLFKRNDGRHRALKVVKEGVGVKVVRQCG
jgi:hypothetical protein